MSRVVQKHNKWDSTFDSCCHLSFEAVAPKARINSLIGFCSKSSSEPGTIGRPKSQLGFRAFFNLGNFFARGPRSLCAIEGQRGIWDCNRVGLGLVYSLNDEDDDKSSMRAIGFSENKNIIFGPQMRTNATSSCVPISPKYVPKDYGVVSTQTHKGSSPYRGEISSCSPELVGSPPSLSMLRYNSLKSAPEVPLKKFDVFTDSLPITLSASEIELSEDYTCITTHGANPKTTHIFGDCILEGSMIQSPDGRNQFGGEERGPLGLLRFPVNFPILHIDDSINSCFSCKKKLQGEGIHIYRGERAFCSYNCRDRDCDRDRELWIEEEEIENPMVSALDSQGLSFLKDMFLARISVAT